MPILRIILHERVLSVVKTQANMLGLSASELIRKMIIEKFETEIRRAAAPLAAPADIPPELAAKWDTEFENGNI